QIIYLFQMGRRKTFMEGGSSSEDEEEGGRISFNISQGDLDAEMAGFSGHQGRRPRRRFGESSDEEEDNERGGLGATLGLGLGPSFLPAQKAEEPKKKEEEKVRKNPVKEKIRARSTHSPSPGPGFAEFNKHSKGFGQKMLEKMGWSSGQGLGADGAGIVNPIETKLRPARMGLSFRGFDERTEQAKVDEKARRGNEDDEEDDEEESRKVKKRNAWKSTKAEDGHIPQQQKSRKPKTVYKTAADILAETAIEPVTQKVLDMTGPGGIREINLADIQSTDSPTWMEVTTRLPELRHNLRLLVDLTRSDLENLSREKQTNSFRMASLRKEVDTIQQSLEKEKKQLERLQQLKSIAQQLEQISKDALATGAYEQGQITSLFGEPFDLLTRDFGDQIKEFSIDALVVSVWAPIMKYKSMHWQVLDEPEWGAADVKRWRHLLIANDDHDRPLDPSDQGWTRARLQPQKEIIATPFETMMNTLWLSKIRSAINNQWDVHHPEPIIQLMEAWEPLLPRFIYENIIHQLILPKLNRAVSEWNPRTDPIMINSWIHPWFPVLKAWRLSELFSSIRQKMAVVLRQWHPSDESALHIIAPWKDVWTETQLDEFSTKYILPKLTLVLREEFRVDPRDQQMDPLIWCLAWKDILSDTILGLLLKNELFSQWHHVLVQWLSLDMYSINYDQISDWYRWWRQVFDAYGLDQNKIIMQEFRKGLDTMNRALNGEDLGLFYLMVRITNSLYREAYDYIKNDSLEGNCIIFVAPDVDSICAVRLFQSVLKTDIIQHKIVPVSGHQDLVDANTKLIEKDQDLRSIVMINCGAMESISNLFNAPEGTKIYVIDSHRPLLLENLSADNNHICVFDDESEDHRVNEVLNAYEELMQAEEDQEFSESDMDEEEDDDNDRPRQRRRLNNLEQGISLNALRSKRRQQNKLIQDYYEAGAYYANSVSGVMYELAHQLGKSSNEFGIVGVTAQYIFERIDTARYTEKLELFKDDRARLNIDRNEDGQLLNPTQVIIRAEDEYRFMLFRHWSLYESMYHSGYVSSKLGVWKDAGKKRLNNMFAKMGFSLQQCQQIYTHMDMDLKQTLRNKIEHVAPLYGLTDICFPSFTRGYGYECCMSASDVVYALSTLIET
ncbi:Cell division control protein 45, partial [Choanephora cucurbitarum]